MKDEGKEMKDEEVRDDVEGKKAEKKEKLKIRFVHSIVNNSISIL